MNARERFLTIVLFFSYLFWICKGLDQSVAHSRVIGGKPAKIKDLPYQLSLEMEYMNFYIHCCGASVISDGLAVTAAHCFLSSPLYTYRLRTGTSFRGTGGKIYEIEDIIIHPEFKLEDDIKAKSKSQVHYNTNLQFDIAVMKVAKPFQFSDVLQPIKLAKTTPFPGTAVILTGWGCISPDGTLPDQLQRVNLNIIHSEDCQAVFHEAINTTIIADMVCAGVLEGYKGGCNGDSGGPLVTEEYQLVGIMSVGSSRYDAPNLLTDVAYLRDWINSVRGTMRFSVAL